LSLYSLAPSLPGRKMKRKATTLQRHCCLQRQKLHAAKKAEKEGRRKESIVFAAGRYLSLLCMWLISSLLLEHWRLSIQLRHVEEKRPWEVALSSLLAMPACCQAPYDSALS